MSSKKLYKYLEISESATDEEIKKAYKKLTLKYHPDRLINATEEEKEFGRKKMLEINEANGVLGNPEKKQQYDQYGDAWLDNKMPDHGNFDMGNMDDIFGGFFGGHGHGHRNQQRNKQPTVVPIQELLQVSLVDLFYGKTFEKEINRILLCVTCDGTGSADKKMPTCTQCKGKGQVIQVVQVGPGMITQTARPCGSCNGTGKGITTTNKCTSCKGSPSSTEITKIQIKVEAGLSNKKVININNMGNEYVDGNKIKKGPVQIILQEVEDPIFKRGFVVNNKQNMADLLIMIDINFVESLCGFSKEIKYIDDTMLYLCETNVIKDGEIKKIPNKGMPYENDRYKMGDLFVKYNVKIPDDLPMETKNKIAELFGYTGISQPSEGSLEVSTVKAVNNDNLDDSDDEQDGQFGHFAQPGQPGVGCRQF